MLQRYRHATAYAHRTQHTQLTLLASIGYFFVWLVLGLLVFPLGVVLAAVEMQQPLLARAVPFAGAAVMVMVGAFQFTEWKTHYLACCRESLGLDRNLSGDAATAWRHGLQLGVHCVYCCGGLMAILLVAGVMDLRAMIAITAAITAERLAPNGNWVARIVGIIVMATGVLLAIQAAHHAGVF